MCSFHRVTAVIAAGKRPVPFRTRKLSLPAPMVLHSTGCGRVGHRRNIIHGRPPTLLGAFRHFETQTTDYAVSDRGGDVSIRGREGVVAG